jgi:aminomethyltransferase
MIERGIGRDGYPVHTVSGEKIGEVTSGSPAPYLKKNIAMAYVPVQYAGPDEVVAVEIRGQLVKARVVLLPFYKRPKKTA